MSAPNRVLRACLLVLAGSWVALGERAASADPTPAASTPDPPRESEALIERGLVLREQGKDEDALPLFERAIALDPSPRARAQLALVNQALGNWVEAERGLAGVLADANDPWVAQRRAALEKALATVRSQLGWLDVQVDVAGAAVSVNGVPAGTTPITDAIRVPAGRVYLEVSAPGHVAAVRLVQVDAGEHAREVLVLPAEPEPATPAGPDVVVPSVPPAPITARARGGVQAQRTAGLVVGGVGIAGLAVGAIGGLTAIAEKNSAHCDASGACDPGPLNTARTAALVADVGAIGGAVLLAGGVVLFLLAPGRDHGRGSRLTVGPMTGAAGVVVGGDF